MEKKYIIAIAVAGGTVAAVGTGVIIKKVFFSDSEKEDKKDTKATVKKSVNVNDTKKLSGVVHTLVAKYDVELTDKDMYTLVSGVLFWAKKKGLDTLTGEQVIEACNWVSKKNGMNITF